MDNQFIDLIKKGNLFEIQQYYNYNLTNIIINDDIIGEDTIVEDDILDDDLIFFEY